MSARDLAAVALAGGAAWYAWRIFGRGDALPITPPAGEDPAGDYRAKLASAENARRDVLAKNPRSTASGLWQFTKKTWEAVGGLWGPDASKPFGGLKPSAAEQTARLAQLTAANAAYLRSAGLAVSDAALYAAHFLGAAVAVRVLRSADGAQLASLIGSAAMTANRFSPTMTVGQFRAWLARKMGS